VRKGLERKKVQVLGVIPYSPSLSYPTVEQILDELGFEVVCGKEFLEQYISHTIVGAMKPKDAVKYITEDSLLITPWDREDIISAALKETRASDTTKTKISGLILTGGNLPDNPILDLLRRANIPVLLAKTDTYTVASRVHDLTVKIRPQDTSKINTAIKLIKDYVDLDTITKGL
jgi:BioD-like phosphotransacetylase family protein